MPTSDKAKSYGSTDATNGSMMRTPKISHVDVLRQHNQQVQRTHSLNQQKFQDARDERSLCSDDASSIGTFDSKQASSSLSLLRSSFTSQRDSLRHSLREAVDRTFKLGGKACDVRENEGTATITNEVFNLVKNLVGAGALGLPSGIAAFGNAPSALVPAAVVILVMGGIFAYYFHLMGRICQMTGTASYREAWEDAVGDTGSGLVALFTTLMASLGILAYSMILADTSRSLFQTAGIELGRTQCLIGVTVLALWPLCNVKKLAVLAPFSLLGMAGMVFTVVAMAWRYYDGSYESGSGRFVDNIADEMKPSFGTIGASGALGAHILLLVCMTFQAFFAHYNSPRYYVELINNTVQRFGIVVGISFGISALLYVVLAAYGFLTFGANSSGFILNNYATNDMLATICRVAIAISLVFTYPLPFIGTRDGILDLLEVPIEKKTSQNLNVLTVVILAFITLLAMRFQDLGKVNAVGGALFGTAVVFLFPTLMLRHVVEGLGFHASRRDLREVKFVTGLMWAGIVMGGMGVAIAMKD